jgi:hypothetical protein
MRAAETNIDGRLANLQQEYRQERQEGRARPDQSLKTR